MKTRDLEKRLRTAAEHAAPGLSERVLSADAEQKGCVMEMPAKITHKKIWIPVAAAAAFLLVFGSIFGYRTYAYNQVDSIIGLDVNPSVELKVNRDEKVLRADALNGDAEKILDGMELRGTGLDVAVNALIGSMLKNGYIDELANSVLISVENGDSAKSAALQKQLTAEIEKLLGEKQIDGSVICQGIGNDEALQKLADANHISLGKARLVSQIVGQNPNIKFEDAAKLSINQLNLLAGEKGTQLADATTTGKPSDKAYIGTDKALEAALSHTGVKASAASEVKVELGLEDGVMVYEVEFISGNMEYEIDVDAVKGGVLKASKEAIEKDDDDDDDGPGQGSTGTASKPDAAQGGSGQQTISKDRAKEIALNHAGLAEKNVSRLETSYEKDDGIPVYEVEFISGNTEYEYKIHAVSGAVMKVETGTKSSVKPVSSAPQAGGTSSAAAKDIGAQEAKRIALAHAGVSEQNARNVKADLDDDGVLVYEVEFTSGNTEYEYEILAQNGAVKKARTETKD